MKSENTLHYNNQTYKAAKGTIHNCHGCAFYSASILEDTDCAKANEIISCLGAVRNYGRYIHWKLTKQKDTENA